MNFEAKKSELDEEIYFTESSLAIIEVGLYVVCFRIIFDHTSKRFSITKAFDKTFPMEASLLILQEENMIFFLNLDVHSFSSLEECCAISILSKLRNRRTLTVK